MVKADVTPGHCTYRSLLVLLWLFLCQQWTFRDPDTIVQHRDVIPIWTRTNSILFLSTPYQVHNLTRITLWGNITHHFCILITYSVELLPRTQGLYSLSGRIPYNQISWSLGDARLDIINIVSLKIWQTFRQRCCWCVNQISERWNGFKPESRGFETSRDLVVRRPSA